jgi:hypothetical protein
MVGIEFCSVIIFYPLASSALFLFARILYSLDGFLRVVLELDHPLFSQPFLSRVDPADLLLWKATIHDCKFRCSCMHATGVPGHVASVGEVQKLRQEVRELRALLESKSAEIISRCDEKRAMKCQIWCVAILVW